jgi:hypothetical protein
MDYIINLFGTGIRYWICEIPLPVFEKMNTIRLNHKVEWEELLFDFDFLQHFGYKHWSELSDQPEQTGFLLDPQNRIEIKQGAKFIARFRAHELLDEETLFPLYQTTIADFLIRQKQGYTSFVLIQFEKGLIGKFRIKTEIFNIEHLCFMLCSISEQHIVSELRYTKEALKLMHEDAFVVGTHVYFL